MPRRSRVEGESLRAVLDEARRTHGPDARVVSAERVITGGIAGLFGRQRYEAVVEVPDPVRRRAPDMSGTFPRSRRAGIAALLDEADDADRLEPSADHDVQVSTRGDDFAALLAGLVTETTGSGNKAGAQPGEDHPDTVTEVEGPSTRPGDLVALFGLADDAVPVVRDMAARLGVLPGCAGLAGAEGLLRLDSRRDAVEARAMAVRAGRSAVLAVGIGPDGAIAAGLLERLEPDEVWVVVDASRKPDDSQAWVGAVRRAAPVRAMAVVSRELTSTPESVDVLALPVGWEPTDAGPGA